MINKIEYDTLLNGLTNIGITVDVSNILRHPVKGQSDGLSIQINCDLKIDDRFYILVHLFGHLLQSKNISDTGNTYQIEIDAIERAIGFLESIKLPHLTEFVSNRFKKDVQYFNDLSKSKTNYLSPRQVEMKYDSDGITLQLNPIKFEKHNVQKNSLIKYL